MFSWQVPGDEKFQCGRSHHDVEDLVITETASNRGTAEYMREKVTSSRSMQDSQEIGLLLQFHRQSSQFRVVIPHAVDVAKRTEIGVNCDWCSSEIHSERAHSGHQHQGFLFPLSNSEVPPDEASDSDSILHVPSHRLSEKEPLRDKYLRHRFLSKTFLYSLGGLRIAREASRDFKSVKALSAASVHLNGVFFFNRAVSG